jgi:hypothetical protein
MSPAATVYGRWSSVRSLFGGWNRTYMPRITS